MGLHAVRPRLPRTVGTLDRDPKPNLLRKGLRGIDLLDRNDAVALADVVERLAQPLGVEHRVERRRNGSVLHGAERYRRVR